MSRIKYGIDLGTTNSGIAVIEKGESIIVKSEIQKDTIPSCISFSKKQTINVGDRAYNQLMSDKIRAFKAGKDTDSNTFIEFKRTMGTDKKYHSSFMNNDYLSEELSSEVLKKLKSFTQEESLRSIVITVPAMFNDNQKASTRKAAELAGFSQVELLQEPIAAAMAFGVDEKAKDGEIIIFDFGGGTFDVCLVNIEEGIMQVKDTSGDNWLGGKNLDQAIVDEIIIPYLQENYCIDGYLKDENKKGLLKQALKGAAEEIKINLSFSETYDVISNIGDYPEDDNGEEIELDLTVTLDKLREVIEPIFQKSIDITKELLQRNNLNGTSIKDLILVGGPTFSPILRKLLEDQICIPNTNVDPMTVVARGAAIYAMQFEVDSTIQEEIKDVTKIQMDLSYEPQSVESEEMLVVKVNNEKTDFDLQEKIFAVVKRSDGGWESDKTELSEAGDIIDLQLRMGKPNIFEIKVSNSAGDSLECEPSEITIIQGIKTGNATLPYSYGVELTGENGKANFYCIPGLEKNKTMPANGEKSGLKTPKDIRPGTNDQIDISIYQGSTEAEGTRAMNQTWVGTVSILGSELPRLLPKNSEINLFLTVVSDGVYNLSVDIPLLEEVLEKPFDVSLKQKGEDDQWFEDQFRSLEMEIKEFERNNEDYDFNKINNIKSNINDIKHVYSSRKSDEDTRMQTRDNLRKEYANFDNIENDSAWPSAESDLRDAFYALEDKSKTVKNERLLYAVDRFKRQLDNVINKKDVEAAKELKSQINSMLVSLLDDEHGVDLYIGILLNFNDEFDSQAWIDKSKARSILDNAMREIGPNADKNKMKNYCSNLYHLLPKIGKEGKGNILKK